MLCECANSVDKAAYFPAVHYILGMFAHVQMCIEKAPELISLGSWYRGHEISRRGGVWYTGLPLGTLTAGLVQAGATRQLDGVHGLSGWRHVLLSQMVEFADLGLDGCILSAP